jgi:hypothetical protein
MERNKKDKKNEKQKSNNEKQNLRFYLFIFSQPDKSNKSIRPSNIFKVIQELDKIKTKKEETGLYFLLESRGGDIYSAYKIINTLRSKCSQLITVVPIRAKSAATLMTLGSDKIVMGPQSELGPLDLPMEHPFFEGIGYRLSALDGIKPLEFFANLSSQMASQLYSTIRNQLGLSRKDSIEIAFKSSEQFLRPITQKLDPWIVNMCDRELCIAEMYSIEFLTKYMLKSKKDAENIANELVRNFPEHSFAISAEKSKDLGLEIIYSNDFDLWGKLWEIYLSLPFDSESIELIENMDNIDNKNKKTSKDKKRDNKIFKVRMV